MPGQYIEIASGGEEKSWTKCVVSNRVSRSFILSGYGGQANLYFKDLLPENPIKLGDFLEVTFRPDAATPTGNLVTGYRSCPPICPRSISIKHKRVKLHLRLAVRFKCFLYPDGPLGGLPLYSSQFVDVVDYRRVIPLPVGRRLGETLHHVTVIEMRDPNNKNKHVWVAVKVLSDYQMSRLVSQGTGTCALSLCTSAGAVAIATLNVSAATDMDKGSPDQIVPTVTNGSCGGRKVGRWSSGTSLDSEAVVESSTPSSVDQRRADGTDHNPTLVPEVREWFIDEVKFTDDEEEDREKEELTNVNATNGSGDKKRADRYGLVPRISHLSRPPSPIASALTPPSDAADKTADSAPLAVKSSAPDDNGVISTPSTFAATPSDSVAIEPPLKDSTMVPALVVSRLPDKFILCTSTFEACLYFDKVIESVAVGDSLDVSTSARQRATRMYVVTKYRHRQPFCDSFVEKSPAGDHVRINLYITYKCDVNWGSGMVPCFSSNFVDVIDHRRLIRGLKTGGRWKVRVSQFRDLRDHQKHIWAVTKLLQMRDPRVENDSENDNGISGRDKRRPAKCGLVPSASRLSPPPPPVASSLAPPSEAAVIPADSVLLAMKTAPAVATGSCEGSGVGRRPSEHSVDSGAAVELSAGAASTADERVDQTECNPVFASEIREWINNPALVSKIRQLCNGGGKSAEDVEEKCDEEEESPSCFAVVTPLGETVSVSEEDHVPLPEVSRTEKAAKNKEKKDNADSEDAAAQPPQAVSLDVDVAENPIAAPVHHDDNYVRLLTLNARLMGDRSLRVAIQVSFPDIFDELIDRIVGVVVAQ